MNIAILTNFQEFNPGHSLSGIVKDQVITLLKYGHNVHLFVNEQYNNKYGLSDSFLPLLTPIERSHFKFHKVIPFGHLIDYDTLKKMTEEHKFMSEKVSSVMTPLFKEHDIHLAFTHDWVFTGWNLPYAGGITLTSRKLPDISWMHWIHSVPSVQRDWWDLNFYGQMHKIIFPNVTELTRVSEEFKTMQEGVRIIPHIKDLRTWYDFDISTCRFIRQYPAVMDAEIVQVYPASSDRLDAKQVNAVIQIFGELKKKKFSVCLVIANQWATGAERKADIKRYYEIAEKAGLKRDVDFIFTSEWEKEYETGIPRKMLRELQLCSNLFIFPTVEESFGLVGPEAALAGNFMVFNKSLSMMSEIFACGGQYFNFGSHHNLFEPPPGVTWEQYYERVAVLIVSRMFENESIVTRTHCRRSYNMDNIYHRYYEPIMHEAITFWKQESQLTRMMKMKVEFNEPEEEKNGENNKKENTEKTKKVKLVNLGAKPE